MRQFMVVEKFRPNSRDLVYGRFYQHGRMLPDGLRYVNSWLEKNGDRCFQLMETDDPRLFDVWIENWIDLVEFEIIELGEKPPSP